MYIFEIYVQVSERTIILYTLFSYKTRQPTCVLGVLVGVAEQVRHGGGGGTGQCVAVFPLYRGVVHLGLRRPTMS